MTSGFWDDLPDLDMMGRRVVKRGDSHTKTHPLVYRFADYPEARKKLTKALNDSGTRQKWKEVSTRIFREVRSYDQKWEDDPNNPFRIEWLKNDLPSAIRKRQFDKLSQEDLSLWSRVVKKRTGLNVLRGSEKGVKIFDKMQELYLMGHRCLYLWTPNISRVAEDEDLICTILALYHDHVSEVVEKIVSDEIRSIYSDMYDRLVNFTGLLGQAELENLVILAEDKGLLKPKPQKHEIVAKLKKSRISLKEANVEAREIFKKEPNPYNIKVRDLAEKIPCSIGLVPKLPVWKAVQERKKQEKFKKGRKAKKVRLTDKMLTVTGTGEKDQVAQLIIAQEEDMQEDEGQAKLFLSHEKKPLTRD